jgi:hypothetical protein
LLKVKEDCVQEAALDQVLQELNRLRLITEAATEELARALWRIPV